MATSSLGYIDDIIRDQIAAAGNDASKLQKIATSFGLSADDLASFKGVSTGDIQQLFRDSGIPLGTLLTGDVQRTFGTDTGIRQVEKGDDIVTEQVVGVQGDKLIVQQYDAYGNPTSRRLTKPNPSELQGWLQALGVVGAAVGAGDLLSSLGGSAGAGSGSLASNLTVGEAASAITNPTQIVTKPITNTLTDYIVNAINSNALAGVEMLPGVAEQVALTAAEKAAIKTGVGMLVNGTASELLGGDFKEGATGTLAGTILNNVPIPGSGDLLGTNKDVPFTSLVGNLATKGLDVTGISDLSNKVSEKLSDGVAKGATAGLTTAIAGGNSNDIYRNTGIGALMGTIGDTKIPGTKLTGDDALELIQDSFLDGSDATNLINNAAGKVVVKADVDPLDQFDPTDFFTGAGFGDDKKTSVAGGSGNDTIKPKPYDANVDANAEDVSKAYLEILGRAGDAEGVKFWDETGLGLNDIINMFKGSDEYKAKSESVTAGSGNDSITAGSGNDSVVVSATGNDSIDLGSANDVIDLGAGNDTIKPYDANVDANREDINKAYVEVLGRVGDESGLDFWDATGLGLKDIVDLFRGSDEFRAKTPSTTVTAGGGNDTLGEDSLSITGGGGNAQVSVTGARDSIGDTISDYIDLGGNNDLVTSGSGNDTIDAGKVTVTGGGSNDSINLGSGNDILTPNVKPSVTVTGGRDTCGAGKTFDPVLGTCIPDDIIDSFCLEGQVFDPLTGLCKPIVRNDTITTDTCPEGQERGTDGVCRAKVEVKSTTCINAGAGKILSADGQSCVCPAGYVEDAIGDCEQIKVDTTITGGGGNDTLTCPSPKVPNAAGTECVCPTGYTTQADGSCKQVITVQGCSVIGQTRNAEGACVCPPGQVVLNDTVSGGQICGTPEDTIRGGGGNDTITECPTGYTYSSKTGKCEFDIAGLPALIATLGGSSNMPGSYNPNLTQPFTATRTYRAPPSTYDYAGADTVGYEDPYFQRFGPITYAPPTNYAGAGNPATTLAGGGVVEAASVNHPDMFFADGGLLSLAQGGRTLPPRYLGGITDGMADRVPAHIDGERPAALSDGEFVIPADVVSHLGNGNSSAGAKVLYEMMDRVRKARTGTKKQGREIDAHRFMPR